MNRPLAIVTGSARRLGKAFALDLAGQGYDLVLHYRSSEAEANSTKEEVERLEARSLLVRADLTDPAQIRDLFEQADHAFSGSALQLLVNSAAVMQVARVEEITLADWDMTLDTNLRAPFLLAQAAAKRMDSGLVVNLSDVGARKAWSRYSSYTVSKAGLEALTRLLARSLAPKIRVNAIAPGLVLPSDVVTADQWDKLIASLPLKRAASLQEITSTLQFLIKNEYITGQTITVDGGYSLL